MALASPDYGETTLAHMNTQTHVLLALGVLAPTAGGPAMVVRRTIAEAHGNGLLLLAMVAGALAPDASLFAMFGYAKLIGMPERTIWTELYYSAPWQRAGAISNSIPLFSLVAALAWRAGARLADGPMAARAALLFSLAALLHTLTDLPLHHDDGHAHFWPFSDWIFASPVSYWDPAHHGRIWTLVEWAVALVLIAHLWSRPAHTGWRTLLSLAAASYAAVGAYWLISLGG